MAASRRMLGQTQFMGIKLAMAPEGLRRSGR
jgi:hypothetical protein